MDIAVHSGMSKQNALSVSFFDPSQNDRDLIHLLTPKIYPQNSIFRIL